MVLLELLCFSIWLQTRVADLQLGSGAGSPADPDPDPDSHQGDDNLRPLVYRSSRAPFWAFMAPLWASVAIHDSILSLWNYWILTSMLIRIQLFNLMRIRIRNPATNRWDIQTNEKKHTPVPLIANPRYKISTQSIHSIKRTWKTSDSP
jgi:hypothetical protein